jgi:hypothetical protein
MAKQVSVRLVSENGEQLKAIFDKIGAAGEGAFEKIGLSAKEAEAMTGFLERALQREEQQINKLRASLDPLYRSSMQYASALDQINSGLRAGVITQAEANRMMDLAAKQYLGAGEALDHVRSSMDRVSTSGRGGRDALRNVALQMNQVAQQGAVTGNYLGAFAIQLPDMLLSFGLWGAAIGTVVGLLGPLAVDMLKTEDAMKVLEKQTDALAASMQALQTAQAAASSPVADLVTNYRAWADQASDVLAVQREIANLDALKNLENIANQISTAWGDLEGDFIDIKGQFSTTTQSVSVLSETARILAREFDISRAQATALAEALQAVGRAEGPAAQAEAMRNAREQIELAAGGLREMDDKTGAIYDALLRAELAATRLAAIDMADNVAAAADEAQRYADYLGISLETAKKLAALGNQGILPNPDIDQNGKLYTGRGGDPRQQGGDLESWQNRDAIVFLDNWKPPRAKRSGRGGRSAAERAAQKEMNDLLNEAERIYESTRTSAERYAEAIDRADQLLGKGLITQDTYARHLEDLQEELRKASKNVVLEDAIDGISDAMSRAILVGDKLRDSLGRVFQQIALDLASSGFKEALSALFQPVLSGRGGGNVFTRLLGQVLSFEGGGYTGSGARSGGIDGRGGFVGILHPQETVIDHLKKSRSSTVSSAAGASGGAVDVRVYVDEGGNWQAAVAGIAGNVALRVLGGGLDAQQQSLGARVIDYDNRGTSG